MKKGDTVICIDDSKIKQSNVRYTGQYIKKGEKYIVRGEATTHNGIYIEGIVVGYFIRSGVETPWKRKRFVKIEPNHETEIMEEVNQILEGVKI